MVNNPAQSKEVFQQSPAQGIGVLQQTVNQLKQDKNFEKTAALRELKSSIEPEKQEAGLTYLKTRLMAILAKLKKKNPDFRLNTIQPGQMEEKILESEIRSSLDAADYAALRNLSRLMDEEGPTKDHLVQYWPELLIASEMAQRGVSGQFADAFRKKPVQSALLIGVGVVGVIWASSLIKKLWQSDAKGSDGKTDKKKWMAKKVLIPIAAILIGLLGGKAALKNFLATMKDEKLQALRRKIAKAKNVPKGVKKKVEQEIARRQQLKQKRDQLRQSVSTQANKGKDVLKDRNVQFNTASKIFHEFYFHNDRLFPPNYLNKIKQLTLALKASKAFDLKRVYERYAKEKAVPAHALPVDAKGIKPAHLFILLKGINDVYQLVYKGAETSVTVEDLFVQAANNPIFKMNAVFHKAVMDNVKNGSFSNLGKLDYRKINESLLQKKDDFIDSVNKGFQYNEVLTPKEKIDFRGVQVALFMSPFNLDMDAKSAVRQAIAHYSTQSKAGQIGERVRGLSERFFVHVQDQTKALIPQLHNRFGITRLGGRNIENLLAKHLTYSSLTFRRSVQLMVMSGGINWTDQDKKGAHWMKDLALLHVILASLPSKTEREEYVGQLSRAFFESDTNLKLPAIAGLRPYFKKMVKFGIDKAVDWGYGVMKTAAAWRDHDLTIDQMRKSPWTSFATKGVGGSIEMSTDALALMITTIGLQPKDLSSTQTAEDLFSLILAKGGRVVYPKTAAGRFGKASAMAIEYGGKYFFFKPVGAAKDTLTTFFQNSFGEALKVYLVHGAPFFVVGAGAAAFLPGRVPNRLWRLGKALAYPVYLPYMGGKIAINTLGTGFSAKTATVEYARRIVRTPAHIARGVMSWSKSMGSGFNSATQNLTNMAQNAVDLNHYLDGAHRLKKSNVKHIFKEVWDSPSQIPHMLAHRFNERMAFRYASRFARNYNNFFDFRYSADRLTSDIADLKRSPEEVSNHAKKAKQFYDSLKKLSAGLSDAKSEVLAALRSGQAESDIIKIFKRFDFDPDQAVALYKQVDNEKKAIAFFEKVARETKHLDRISMFARGRDLVKSAFQSIRGTSASAPKAAPTPTRPGVEVITGAKFGTRDIMILAGYKDESKIAKYLTAKGLPQMRAAELAKQISQTDDLGKIVGQLQAAGVEKAAFSSKLVALARYAKFAGNAAMIGFTVYYGFETYHTYQQFSDSKNADRRGILGAKLGLMGGNLVLDTVGTAGLVAGTFGGSGAVATGIAAVGGAAGTISLGLLPATYIASGAIESMYERTKTIQEWMQTDRKKLIHDWMTTTHMGAGDLYRDFFTGNWRKGSDQVMGEKQTTREKIVGAIISMDENKRGEPNPDRLYYFKVMNNYTPPVNYKDALSLLRESKIYADIMKLRRGFLLKKKKDPSFKFMMGNVDLTDSKYDKPDGGLVQDLIANYRLAALSNVPKNLMTNFSQFSDRYLIDLYCDTLTCTDGMPKDLTEEQLNFKYYLRNYLIAQRRVDVDKEYRDWLAKIIAKSPDKKLPRSKIEELKNKGRRNMDKFLKRPNEALKEDLKNQPNQAEYTLYQVAKFFGYTGVAKEEPMKKFFDSAHAGEFGVYWSGSAWYMNDDYGLDDKMGSKLDDQTIKNILHEYKNDWQDIFASRSKALVDIGGSDTFKDQAQSIAKIMEKAMAKKFASPKILKPFSGSDAFTVID